MNLSFRLKRFFFNAFREIFIHHHSSLEFRAKLFALVLSAKDKATVNDYIIVRKIAMDIYENDEERANLLMVSTKEIRKKIEDDNKDVSEILIHSIQKQLKIVPRYATKIEIEKLKDLLAEFNDKDTISYQENILEFLQTIKEETMLNKRSLHSINNKNI